jgi:hypothetical protein
MATRQNRLEDLPRKSQSSEAGKSSPPAASPGPAPDSRNIPAAAPAQTPDLQEAIRTRAYELYEQRGRAEGHDVEDWLQAETEIRARQSQGKAAA